MALECRSDAELVLAVQGGEVAAWDTLVGRYAGPVHAISRRFLRDRDDVAEVQQATWTAAWEGLPRLRDASRFGPWLLTICARTARDLWRLRRRSGRLAVSAKEQADADPAVQPEPLTIAVESSAEMQAALERLPERCRALIRLLYFDPRSPSYKQIARELGTTSNTVGSWRHRCLISLRQILETSGHLGISE